ncbi:MAG TPA: hypothetical protein VH877_11915 [Polyangia bacterium]|jgi:hypothetical protein|nr:hypothetical protein [Polyangia bacterium]
MREQVRHVDPVIDAIGLQTISVIGSQTISECQGHQQINRIAFGSRAFLARDLTTISAKATPLIYITHDLYLHASCIAVLRLDKQMKQQGFLPFSQGGQPEATGETVKLKRCCNNAMRRHTLERRA